MVVKKINREFFPSGGKQLPNELAAARNVPVSVEHIPVFSIPDSRLKSAVNGSSYRRTHAVKSPPFVQLPSNGRSGTHRIYQQKGEEFVRALIQKIRSRWSVPRTDSRLEP